MVLKEKANWQHTWSWHNRIDVAVRCGGPNAGHSFTIGGQTTVLRQVPVAVVNPGIRLLIAPGAVIEPHILIHEIKDLGLTPERLGLDPYAALITESEKQEEVNLGLRERISSTLSGTGVATAKKVLRQPDLQLAKNSKKLRPFLVDVAIELNQAYDSSRRILVEGTQGFGLSLHHSQNFPFATSRDTSASNFLSEVGLSPTCSTEIIMVVRTYPIRVAGNSGPLQNEVSWSDVTQRSGSDQPICEYTSVTKKVRRVGLFEKDAVRRAVLVNRPTALALHGVDYLDYSDRGKRSFNDLSSRTREFIDQLEHLANVPVRFIFTGPELLDVIER